MNKRIRKRYKFNNRNIILEHIKTNINIYIIILTLFLIGLFVGVIIINNIPETQAQNIKEYMTNSINLLKTGNKLLKKQMLKQSLTKNFIIILIIWILGLTFFGKYLIYFITFVLGLMFGYTTSALMLSFNVGQSLLLFISSMLLQNIITIPTIVFLSVQGIKCHNEFSDKKNIKYIVLKYTSFSILGMLLLFISSIVEVYICDNLMLQIAKYL